MAYTFHAEYLPRISEIIANAAYDLALMDEDYRPADPVILERLSAEFANQTGAQFNMTADEFSIYKAVMEVYGQDDDEYDMYFPIDQR
jgi:hypothetical protein